LEHELGKQVQPVGPDDSLLESGILDSVAVMQLVAFLERTYGITVADDDLVPENFDSLTAISAYVTQRQAEAHG
jgi:acyl carrier protein